MFGKSTSSVGTADLDQQRICRALVSLIEEKGYAATSLEDLLDRSEIDLSTFERTFTSLDECFAEVWKEYTLTFRDPLLSAFWAQPTWRDGMRALGWELCRLTLEDRLRARICLVEVNYGGDLVQGTRDLVLNGYVELVHLGRRETGSRRGVRREQAEAVVGAIWERAGRTVKAGDLEALVDVVPELLYLVYLPYLGAEVAQEELRRGREDLAQFKQSLI
ncbi:MAG TPA: TetR/AcrR family transcriptional regulator [Solirubrobacterales bacterium]|jgi:AcrR family transcriptional regulator